MCALFTYSVSGLVGMPGCAMTTNGAWPADGVASAVANRLPCRSAARADKNVDVSEINARTFKVLANMEGAAGLGCWHVGFRSWSGSMNGLCERASLRRNR
jgi:hypothetical protein